MRTILCLIACATMASCYPIAGPQGGTRDVNAPDHGADAGAPPSYDGGGADAQLVETAPTPEDPVKLLVLEQVQGKTVCYDTEGVHGVRCGTAKIVPREAMIQWHLDRCTSTDVAYLEIEIEGYGGGACIESDWVSLSLCKNDATICDGQQKKGTIFLGTCAFPGGQTVLQECTRADQCGNGGYCNTNEEQDKKIVLNIYWFGEFTGKPVYFFPKG